MCIRLEKQTQWWPCHNRGVLNSAIWCLCHEPQPAGRHHHYKQEVMLIAQLQEKLFSVLQKLNVVFGTSGPPYLTGLHFIIQEAQVFLIIQTEHRAGKIIFNKSEKKKKDLLFWFPAFVFSYDRKGGFYSGWFAAVVQRYLNINVGPQRDFIC